MKFAIAVLVITFLLACRVLSAEQGATNTAPSLVPMQPLSDADWRTIAATQSRKPLSAMSITNRLSQVDILSISDPISASSGLTRYIDAMCGLGARLERDYIGTGAVVRVSFLWDGSPKVTRFSFHGTNRAAATTWHTEMFRALRKKLGEQSVRVEAQPSGPANRSQPVGPETNRTAGGTGSRR